MPVRVEDDGLTNQQRWRLRRAGVLPPYVPAFGKRWRDMTREERLAVQRHLNREYRKRVRATRPIDRQRSAAINSWRLAP